MIVQRAGKWVLLSSDGAKVLGTHETYENALAQERAIQIAKRGK